MSYESDECKLLIDEAIHDYLHDDTENEMAVKDWFYDLRKQATKADEYEAKGSKHRTHVNDIKAEAFDAILKAYDEAFSREHMADEVSDIIEKYESGESDANDR